jgi:hypothetical protein
MPARSDREAADERRRAAIAWGKESCLAQGVPFAVTDPAILDEVVRILWPRRPRSRQG